MDTRVPPFATMNVNPFLDDHRPVTTRIGLANSGGRTLAS
jgi:hypothetical protein